MPRIKLWKSGVMLLLGVGLAAVLHIARTRASNSDELQLCANVSKPPQAELPRGMAFTELASAAYDPVAMVEKKTAPGYQIFDRETAVEPWATAMRDHLGGVIRQALLPFVDARLDSLECRQASCRMMLTMARRHWKTATLAVQQPPIAPAFSLGQSRIEADRFFQEGFVFFRPDNREISAYRRWREDIATKWNALREQPAKEDSLSKRTSRRME